MLSFNQQEKITVFVKSDFGVQKKKYQREGNYIIIKKGKGVRGDPTIKAKFNGDCFLHKKTIFGWKKYLYLIEGNSQCVNWKTKEPKLGYFDVKGFFEAGAVKNEGATLQTVKIPFAFYLIVGAVLVMQVISMLIFTGRLRL